MTDLALLPATELAKLFKRRKASPVEAAKAAYKRIEKFQPLLNCMQHVDEGYALRMARASEKRWKSGKTLSPLDGVPITIKDMVYTKGMPTRMGSAATPDAGPWDMDGPSAANMRAAGAVFLGKTTSPEYGWKGVTDSPLYGTTHNPWKIGRTPGGSSGGGTAACAVGIGNLAIGSDGAGSVRIPCSFTGLVGLKGTFARVPVYPPSAMGTLSNVGPMTRTVRDAAAMQTWMARPDVRDWYSIPGDVEDYSKGLEKGVKGLKVAFSPTLGFVDDVHPEVAAAVEKAVGVLKKLGAKVTREDPKLDGLDPRQIEDAQWIGNVSVVVKNFPPEKQALMDPGFRKSAAAGAAQSAETYIRSTMDRRRLGSIFNQFLDRYDLLVCPTMPLPAFEVNAPAPHGGDGVSIGWTPFTLTFNLTRHPAITVPCGLSKEGLPIGLQIVAKHYADALTLRAAFAYEREVGPFPLPPMATA